MPRIISLIRDLKITYETAARYISSRFGLQITSVNSKIDDDLYERILKGYPTDKAFRRELAKKTPIIGRAQHVRMSPLEKLMAKKGNSSKKNKGRNSVWAAIGKCTHIRFVNVPFGGKGRR